VIEGDDFIAMINAIGSMVKEEGTSGGGKSKKKRMVIASTKVK